jgi:hypothetical protein
MIRCALVLTLVAAPAALAQESGALLVQPIDDPAVSPGADEALRVEREAEVELAVGVIRLGLLKSRARLAQGRFDDAKAMAQRTLAAIDELPDTVNREALVRPLRRVIADADARRTSSPNLAGPVGPIMLTEAGQAERAERLSFEDVAYRDLRKQDERHVANVDDAIIRQGETRLSSGKVLVFPADWKAISERRASYRDGVIYRGPEFRDEGGELKQTIVYDIGDLTHRVPRFSDAPRLDLHFVTQNALDRDALRRSSDIFTGFPRDLEEGIPLLEFFGGVDEHFFGGDNGQTEQSDLMRIMGQVLEPR